MLGQYGSDLVRTQGQCGSELARGMLGRHSSERVCVFGWCSSKLAWGGCVLGRHGSELAEVCVCVGAVRFRASLGKVCVCVCWCGAVLSWCVCIGAVRF